MTFPFKVWYSLNDVKQTPITLDAKSSEHAQKEVRRLCAGFRVHIAKVKLVKQKENI
jgi:hypothetical protein